MARSISSGWIHPAVKCGYCKVHTALRAQQRPTTMIRHLQRFGYIGLACSVPRPAYIVTVSVRVCIIVEYLYCLAVSTHMWLHSSCISSPVLVFWNIIFPSVLENPCLIPPRERRIVTHRTEPILSLRPRMPCCMLWLNARIPYPFSPILSTSSPWDDTSLYSHSTLPYSSWICWLRVYSFRPQACTLRIFGILAIPLCNYSGAAFLLVFLFPFIQ